MKPLISRTSNDLFSPYQFKTKKSQTETNFYSTLQKEVVANSCNPKLSGGLRGALHTTSAKRGLHEVEVNYMQSFQIREANIFLGYVKKLE